MCDFGTWLDLFGDIGWTDAHRVRRLITEEAPRKVAEDGAYQRTRMNNKPPIGWVERDRALGVMMLVSDDPELLKQFSDNHVLQALLSSAVVHATYDDSA
jgi:type I restriction enzyme R subunit